MESVLNVANLHLVGLSFLFTTLRMSELAVANALTLMFLNANDERKATYIFSLFMNGIVTFVAGYPYFLTQKQNHGVYLLLLGSFSIMYATFLHSQEILQRYKENFRAQNEEVSEGEEEIVSAPAAESSEETESEGEEDYSEMPPLIPVRRTDSISDYPAFAEALRTEPLKRPPSLVIPPIDESALLATEGQQEPTKED